MKNVLKLVQSKQLDDSVEHCPILIFLSKENVKCFTNLTIGKYCPAKCNILLAQLPKFPLLNHSRAQDLKTKFLHCKCTLLPTSVHS